MGFFKPISATVATNPLYVRRRRYATRYRRLYDRAGITRDLSTHSERSPTITEPIATIAALLDDPAPSGCQTASEDQKIHDDV